VEPVPPLPGAGHSGLRLLTVETLLLKTYYVLFFIELRTRRVLLAGVTRNPDPGWVTQQARNFTAELSDSGALPRFWIRGRDTKFTRSSDAEFEADGTRIIATPIQAPNANSYAERWMGTVRAECLDWTLVLGQRHLGRLRGENVAHHNAHRPIGRSGCVPGGSTRRTTTTWQDRHSISRRPILGGFIIEYRVAA